MKKMSNSTAGRYMSMVSISKGPWRLLKIFGMSSHESSINQLGTRKTQIRSSQHSSVFTTMSSGARSQWTARQNKKFEMALVVYSQENPERWHKIAKAVGKKDEEDVKRHYELLVKDVRDIESGLVPLPNYKKAGN